MKKKIVQVLTIILIIALFIPTFSFATPTIAPAPMPTTIVVTTAPTTAPTTTIVPASLGAPTNEDTSKAQKIEAWVKNNSVDPANPSVKEAVKKTIIGGNFAKAYAGNELISIISCDAAISLTKTFNTIKDSKIFGTTSEDCMLRFIYDVIKVFALALLCLFFIIEIVDASSNFTITKEQFFRIFIKYLVAKMIIDKGLDIGIGFYNAGMSLAGNMNLTDRLETSAYEAAKNQFYQIYTANPIENLLTGLKYQLQGLIPFGCTITVHLVLFSTVIELGVRMLLLPISAIDVVHSGLKGHGFGQIKKLLAVALSFAIMIICVFVSGLVRISILNTNADTVVSIIIINVITSTSLLKASHYAKELF